MELSREQVKITKGIAIILMVLLHLFCTKDYYNLFTPLIMIGDIPLVYYLALFGDSCVAIYCFCSGYGLMLGYENDSLNYVNKNLKRIFNLYINYWMVLILFVLILGPILGKGNIYPGNVMKFIRTFTGLSPEYNGAWWFFTTYVILVLVSPLINKILLRYNYIFILGITLIIYFFSYLQRVKVPIVLNNVFLDYILRQGSLFGTSLLPFVIGGIFANKKIYSKIFSIIHGMKYKNILGIISITGMIIFHGFVETLFIAPFLGIAFIIIFNLMDKHIRMINLLDYLSKHSTNIWLIHMFFYMIYFKKIIFAPKYPIFIFIWLMILCVISSELINRLNGLILEKLKKR